MRRNVGWSPAMSCVSCDQAADAAASAGRIGGQKGKLRVGVDSLTNIVQSGLKPALIGAGVTKPALDSEGKAVIGKDGRPVLRAKYSGLHTLQHFYASWCINRPEDGGLGL